MAGDDNDDDDATAIPGGAPAPAAPDDEEEEDATTGNAGARTVRKSHTTTVSFMYTKAGSPYRRLGNLRDRLSWAARWIAVVPAMTCAFQWAFARWS